MDLGDTSDETETETDTDTEIRVGVDRRAERFAEILENGGVKVSIAVIQGYLLLHKKDPIKALKKAQEWVEEIRKEQEAGVKGDHEKRDTLDKTIDA